MEENGDIYHIGKEAWKKMEVRHKELHKGVGMPKNRKKVFIDNEDIVINGIQKAFGGEKIKIGLTPTKRGIDINMNEVIFGNKKIENLNTTLLSQVADQ